MLRDISNWVKTFPAFIDDMETLLSENRIFKQRTVDIGVISEEDAGIAWMTGPCLRASGVATGFTRKNQPYDA